MSISFDIHEPPSHALNSLNSSVVGDRPLLLLLLHPTAAFSEVDLQQLPPLRLVAALTVDQLPLPLLHPVAVMGATLLLPLLLRAAVTTAATEDTEVMVSTSARYASFSRIALYSVSDASGVAPVLR